MLNKNKLPIIYYFNPPDLIVAMITGTFLIISFSVFDLSNLSMRLIPILTSTAIVALAYLFLYRYFNKKMAITTSLLFIFAPYAYTIRTFILSVEYTGSIIFTFLIMYIFYNIFYKNNKNYWNFILLGLISGFALSFYTVNFVIILTFILFWFSFDKLFFIKKNFFVFLIAFLVTLSPMILYYYSYNLTSFDEIGDYLKADNKLLINKSQLSKYDSLIKLLTKDIPYSFDFNKIDFITNLVLSYSYYFIFVISFMAILYKNRISILNLIKNLFLFKSKKNNNKEIFIIVYPILYIFAYISIGLAPRPFYYSRILPIYPFIFIIIALFVNHLSSLPQKKWKIFSIAAITFILFFGLKINLGLISNNTNDKVDYIEKCDLYGPNSYRYIGFHLKNITLAKKECQKLDESNWESCYENIGFYIGDSYLMRGNLSKAMNYCLLLDKAYKSCISDLAIYAGGDKEAPQICNVFSSDYKKICFFNFGMTIALNKDAGPPSQECKIVGDEYFNDCKNGYFSLVYGYKYYEQIT